MVFKPLNTGLNVLLLALGLSIITVLILMQNQFESKMARGAEGVDLVVGAKGSPLQLILSSVYHIDFPTGNIPLEEARGLTRNRLVKSAIPLSMGDNYQGIRIVGTNHDYVDLYDGQVQEGRKWERPFEVVIGRKVADELDMKVGSRFEGSHGIASASHAHDEHDYEVVGILGRGDHVLDNLILTSLESVWLAHDEEHDHSRMEAVVNTTGLPETDEEGREITTLLLQYRNPIAAVQLPRFINSRTSMQAASPSFEINRLFELLGVGVSLVQGLAIAIIVVAGLSIFIALFNSMKERKYDLAVMRTLGASKLQLFVHIILEGILLTFIGACLGVLLGHLFVHILVSLNEQGPVAGISAWTFVPEQLYIWVYAVGVGILASLIPAWRAYQTDIASQLTK